MPSPELSRHSKTPPAPATVTHGGFELPYTCHMAAIHWAMMTLGKSQQEANRIVGGLTRRGCPGCIGNGQHTSLSALEYGNLFCCTATLIPNRGALHGMVEVGDVLITAHPGRPTHSMIVRQNRRPDHITVRGFNNTGTLGTGAHLEYDDVSHNISKHKYWHNPGNGEFGLTGNALYVIRAEAFLSIARAVSRLV